MPSLKKVEEVKVYLPSTKDEPNEADRVWCKMRTVTKLSDVGEMDEGNQMLQKVQLLHSFIVDWNLTVSNEDTTKLPVTVDNVDAYCGQNLSDFLFLAGWVQDQMDKNKVGLSTDEKKTSSGISVATEPTETPPPII